MGQVVCGAIVARHSLRQGIWGQARHFFILLVSVWFMCSGCLELLVSGLETATRLGASVSIVTVDLWRARADTALAVVSLLLLLSLLVYAIARRSHAGSPGPDGESASK